MKTRKPVFLLLFVIAFSFSTVLAQEDKSEWEYVSANNDNTYFMNSKRIKTDQETIKAYLKVVPKKDDRGYVAILYEFNCKKQMGKPISFTLYMRGKQPQSKTVKDEWEDIYPDTIYYKLLVTACSKENTKPEENASANIAIQSLGAATLKGLKGVHILIETLPPKAEEHGLRKDQLKTDIEIKLRKAKIEVFPLDEFLQSPDKALLHVSVGLLNLDSQGKLYAYFVKIAVIQSVRLVRDPSIKEVTSTYQVDIGYGSVEMENIRSLREDVSDKIDVFINDFLKTNPK